MSSTRRPRAVSRGKGVARLVLGHHLFGRLPLDNPFVGFRRLVHAHNLPVIEALSFRRRFIDAPLDPQGAGFWNGGRVAESITDGLPLTGVVSAGIKRRLTVSWAEGNSRLERPSTVGRAMKKIAILPTLLTLGNAVCGFASIVVASRIACPSATPRRWPTRS